MAPWSLDIVCNPAGCAGYRAGLSVDFNTAAAPILSKLQIPGIDFSNVHGTDIPFGVEISLNLTCVDGCDAIYVHESVPANATPGASASASSTSATTTQINYEATCTGACEQLPSGLGFPSEGRWISNQDSELPNDLDHISLQDVLEIMNSSEFQASTTWSPSQASGAALVGQDDPNTKDLLVLPWIILPIIAVFLAVGGLAGMGAAMGFTRNEVIAMSKKKEMMIFEDDVPEIVTNANGNDEDLHLIIDSAVKTAMASGFVTIATSAPTPTA